MYQLMTWTAVRIRCFMGIKTSPDCYITEKLRHYRVKVFNQVFSVPFCLNKYNSPYLSK